MSMRIISKFRFTAAILAVMAVTGAWAQETAGAGKKVTIDELRSPTSPAFTILGIAPTNVIRPNTPRELAVELLSAKERGDGEFPSDLALEIAPYWLASHPELNFFEYYQPTNIGQTILRSLSVSVASSKIPDDAVEGTTMGVGIRFLLVPGKMSPELQPTVQQLKDIQVEFLDKCVPDIPDNPGGAEQPSNCTPEELAAFDAKMRKVGDGIRGLDLQRTGWVVEAALAASRDYPSADGAASHARQVGAWVTASYKARDPKSLTLLTAARFLEDRTGEANVRMTDLGGRLIYESSQMPLSLSMEVMYRDIENGDSSTSVLGVLEYPISDSLRLVASYGKGLATPTHEADLQATISVNFGFGKGPGVSFDHAESLLK
ncbi:MAG TPA: hypothetical protein VGO61_12110 [Steroidobacteraceae bacterium]|jgi:hypothetical protein|nr:hypothetical protein [Steroidobacteraceae bacterium]